MDVGDFPTQIKVNFMHRQTTSPFLPRVINDRQRRLLLGALTVSVIALGAAEASAASPAGNPSPQSLTKPFIIGGSEVAQGRYPYVAELTLKRQGSDDVPYHACGGSLISPSVVLTAAHCVTGMVGRRGAALATDLNVVVNRADQRQTHLGQERRVRYNARNGQYDIIIHPRYGEGGTHAFDVAVILLDKPVTGVEPLKLPSPGSDAMERPGALLTVAGWGNTFSDTGVDQPEGLRSVRVPVVASWECSFAYPMDNPRPSGRFQPGSMMCAGVRGQDSCQGDSGGPLFAEVPGTTTVVQVGVVSWGNGCGKAGMPGVYAKLSAPEIFEFISAYSGQ
ncbi:S1 family serine peptidase [Stenotrophomonas tumulicola]|uniref:Serine protease n=1 Tax=Stenotrophomonas tumulicola TaxID=1685415 RepID=A0A7W3FPA5_9GAMM|nr:serine protease [Stenotrophomonas tumulicola]MBA8683246.1 serine protease [Stenotrophomonas tumulicola]